MSFVIPLIYMILMSGLLTLVLKRRFEEVLPSAIMLSGIVLYLASFLHHMSVGFGILLLTALIYPAILVVKRKNAGGYLERILTPGFIVFVGLYTLIYLLNLNRGFTEWDEFSHWGPMVKEMLRIDTFYSDPLSKLYFHKDYPPAITLIEVLWCKFGQLAGKEYRENTVYVALQTFMLSMYMPAFSRLDWKGTGKAKAIVIALFSGFIVVLMQLFVGLGEARIYTTIYTDGTMAVIFAYSVFLIFSNTDLSIGYYFQLSMSLAYLLLSKQMGLALFMLSMAIFVVNALIRSDIYIQLANIKKIALSIVIIFLCPMLGKVLWDLYIKKLGIMGQFSLGAIKIGTLYDIASGNGGQPWQHEAFINFFNKFIHEELEFGPIRLSYWKMIIMFGIGLWLVGAANKDNNTKKQIHIIDMFMVLGGFAYAGAMLLLYVYAFGEWEGPRIVCYPRYIGTYIFGFFAFIVMVCIKEHYVIEIRKGYIISLLVCSFLLLIIPTNNILQLHASTSGTHGEDFEIAKQIIDDNTEEDSKIYLISQGDNGWDKNLIAYLTLPREYNGEGYSLGDRYYDNDVFTQNIDLNTWAGILEGYDYVYLKHVDDQFVNGYGDIFGGGEPVQDRQLYKIEILDNGKIQLYLLN